METAKVEEVLHFRIKEAILDLIKSDHYKPHDQLPTEADFCKRFGVSRTTVRTALQQLALEGYVYRKQGKGTFVSEHKVKQTLTSTVTHFSEQLTLQGKKPSIKVLGLSVIEATTYLSELFQIDQGDPVNKLERIRYADNGPLQYEVAFLPWKKTPGLNIKECERSLYGLLESEFQLKIKRTVEHLELFMADDHIAELLEVKNGAPCFSLETYAYLNDYTAIEYSKTFFRGDRANFVIERNY